MGWLDSNEENVLQAAKDGDYGKALRYINKGASLSYRTDGGYTALHWAAAKGQESIVKLLLEKGADIHGKNDSGETALHRAAGNENESVVKMLLEKGAKIHDKKKDGFTALHVAAGNGQEKVARLLLDNGAKIHDKTIYGSTVLHCAVLNGCENVVKLLLERGAKIDERNNDGKTPLDYSRSTGKLSVVEILNTHYASKLSTSPAGGSSSAPPSCNNKVLMNTLIEIACSQIQPSMLLLKQRIKPENVVDVAALLAGHNIVLIALRGGLLEKPYSTLDNDPDWFKDKLYHPIYDKVKSKEERDMVMKVVNHAESMGIIRNAYDIRQSIIINDKIERKMETIGTVIADIYQRINKIEAGVKDVTQHSKSIGLGLKQFHQAYQQKRKMDRISGLLRLVTSAIPFAATAVGESVGMGFELLLLGVEQAANRAIDKFTDVDLADFRVAQWIVSENYQKCLPEYVRELFEKEVHQTFGGMSELENGIYEMMKDCNTTPLNILRRSIAIGPVSQQARSASESVVKYKEFRLNRNSNVHATNQGKRSPMSFASTSSAGVPEWSAQYNKYVIGFGESDLGLEDAAALASKLSGKDEATCELVLSQVDQKNTGRFSRMRFVLAMEELSVN